MVRTPQRWTSVAALSLVLAATSLCPPRLLAADAQPKPPAPPDTAGTSSAAAAPRFFELRIYTAAPGKLEALHKRFRDHTLRLFEKHGIQNVAYWTAVDEKNVGKLYFVIAYPDKEGRDRMLVNGIGKDPEFLKAVAESEKDGKLTTATESVLMTPTDYSPVK